MLSSLQGNDIAAPEETMGNTKEQADFSEFNTEDITFSYCTEFIVSRENDKDPELLRPFLSNLGDSLVLVADDEIIKVHVHTNHPGTVFEEALTYGSLVTSKIENMYRAGADRQNAVHAIEIAFDHSYVVHRGNANRLIDILGHAETVQTVQDSFRGAKRVFIGDQQQALRKMVLLQDLSHLMDKPAPDLDVLDGAFVLLPAGAVLKICDQLFKIQHGPASCILFF